MAQRTWGATIEVRDGRTITTITGSASEYDLKSDQTATAIREAAAYATDTSQVVVTLLKTTKSGTRRDRTFVVFRDRHGAIRYQ